MATLSLKYQAKALPEMVFRMRKSGLPSALKSATPWITHSGGSPKTKASDWKTPFTRYQT